MKRRLHGMLSMLALAAVSIAPAAAQSATWERVIDVRGRGEVNALILADNGDIIVGGFAPNARGAPNPWVARFTPAGETVWIRQYGAPVREEAQDLALAADGEIVVGGIRYIQPLTGTATLARLSPEGDLLWNNTIANEAEGAFAYQVEHIENGAAIAVGGARLGDRSSRHATVVQRINADGTVVWTFGPINDATYSPDAVFESFDAFATRRPDGDLELHDSTGGIARCIVLDAASGALSSAPCVTPPIEGSGFSGAQRSYRAGSTTVGPTGDPYVHHYDGAGRLLWERILPSPEGDGFRDADTTPDGGVVAVGFRNAAGIGLPAHELAKPAGWHNWDGLVVKFDAKGDLLWRRVIGGERREELKAVAVLPDGSIIAAGSKGLPGEEMWSPWIIRLDADGELRAANADQTTDGN